MWGMKHTAISRFSYAPSLGEGSGERGGAAPWSFKLLFCMWTRHFPHLLIDGPSESIRIGRRRMANERSRAAPPGECHRGGGKGNRTLGEMRGEMGKWPSGKRGQQLPEQFLWLSAELPPPTGPRQPIELSTEPRGSDGCDGSAGYLYLKRTPRCDGRLSLEPGKEKPRKS